MKDAARALDAEDLDDGDLIHTEDDGIRDDLIEMIDAYNWRFGAGDFILSSREINPLEGTLKEQQLRKIERSRDEIPIGGSAKG